MNQEWANRSAHDHDSPTLNRFRLAKEPIRPPTLGRRLSRSYAAEPLAAAQIILSKPPHDSFLTYFFPT